MIQSMSVINKKYHLVQSVLFNNRYSILYQPWITKSQLDKVPNAPYDINNKIFGPCYNSNFTIFIDEYFIIQL